MADSLPSAHALSVDVHSLVLAGPLPSDRHPVAVYLARLAPGSRRTMHGALMRLAALVSGGHLTVATLDWSALRYAHTAALRALLADTYAPATANKMLAALRGVLKEAWRLGHLDAEAYHRAVDVAPVRGRSKPPGRALTLPEMTALFDVCARAGPPGVRDAALVALLLGVGLRRFEAAALQLADWDRPDGTLWVASGKGRQARPTYPPPGAVAALSAWLRLRGEAPGPLFYPFHRGRRLLVRPLSDQAIYDLVVRRAKQAGVTRFSPHDLRRTFISGLLSAGHDLAVVQSLAGHAQSSTTVQYDRRGETPRRQAAAQVHIPYVAPVNEGLSHI